MSLDLRAIDSNDDTNLKDYQSLTDVALRMSQESDTGIYIAESLKILARAINAGHRVRSVLTSPTWIPKLEELNTQTAEGLSGVPVFVGDDELLESITGFHVHRGTLASVWRPTLASVPTLLANARRVVVLENIVDHTNVGAVFRSVAGIGADCVIVSPSCADPLYRRSVRVSMGTVMQVPWTRAESLEELFGHLRNHGFHTVALALQPDSRALDEFAMNPPEKLALMFGSEGEGLSPEALAGANEVVSIPMRGGVDSLNVAAASAVVMWALRQGANGSSANPEAPR